MDNNKKIKVLSFDIGNTLIYFDESETLNQLSTELNIEYLKLNKLYKKYFQIRKGSKYNLINKFCKENNIDKRKIYKFFRSKENNIHLNLELINFIKSIDRNKYMLIGLSDNYSFCKKVKLDFLDNIYYSYEIGYTKDDDEIFKYVEDDLKVKSFEIVHIGDNMLKDYKNPKRNNWNAILHKKNKETIKKIEQIIYGGEYE